MALFQSGCDYCGSDRTSDGLGLYMSKYKYQHDWGSAKVFCSYPCLENYKERLVRDKELKKQNEIDDKEREKESRLRDIEESRLRDKEESLLLRESKKEEFKKDFNTVIELFKNNSNDEVPSKKNLEDANDTSKQEPEKTSWLLEAIGFIIIIVIIKLFVRYFL